MLETREEAISNFLQSCKDIQLYSEYIIIDVYNTKGNLGPFMVNAINEIEKLMKEYPECCFKVSNSICLNQIFVDEIHKKN